MATQMLERCRLYLITPPSIADLVGFAGDLARALDAGDVAALQLRLKEVSDDAILRAADTIRPIAAARDVHFILNDRPDLARACGADGVHVGQEDASIAEARRILGADATIGATCHASIHLAMEAGEAGADYVAFGAFFPTATKVAPTRAEPEILTAWTFATTLPCVAIGGVDAGNCAPLVRAGADFLAVSAAVFNHERGPAAGVIAMNEAIAQEA
jgi:thiamine-phosphate pyrophosphorylase